MGQTSKYKIPYPDVNDIANIPGDLQKIAEKTEAIIQKHVMTNENAEDLISKVEQLQTENSELSNNMPWNTTSGKSLHITDSAKYSKNKLEISGDMKQENRSGKNKFKIPESATGYDVTLTKNEDGTFNLSGTATGNASFLAFVDLDKSGIKNGASYIFHFTKNLQAGVEFRVEMYNGTNWLRAIAPNINSTTSTSTGTANTTNATKVRFGIFVTSGTTVNIQNLGVQLEEGTTATEFEKYGAMPSIDYPSMPVAATGVQKIKQFRKNLFNKDNANIINAVVDVNSITSNTVSKSFYIKIEPDTYTISRKVVGSRFVVGTTENIPAIGEKVVDRVVNNSGSSIILNVSKNANYLVVYYLYNSTENEQEILNSIMIYRGTGNSEYEPCIEEIFELDLGTTELCKIVDDNGNTVAQDKAVYKEVDGVWKWQWEKNVGKDIISGTESFFKISSYIKDDLFGVVIYSNERHKQLGALKAILCNKLKTKYLGPTTETEDEESVRNAEGIALHSGNINQICITLNKTRLETQDIAGVKNFFNVNNMTYYYPLLNPTYEDCTSAQSEILDKLYNNFKLSKGTNNIIVESENGVGVEMDLSYMQDLQTKLNLLEAMCVSNASQEV